MCVPSRMRLLPCDGCYGTIVFVSCRWLRLRGPSAMSGAAAEDSAPEGPTPARRAHARYRRAGRFGAATSDAVSDGDWSWVNEVDGWVPPPIDVSTPSV